MVPRDLLFEVYRALFQRRATISYGELVAELPRRFGLSAQSPTLNAALGEVSGWCLKRGLPPLSALVVRADTLDPGDGYFEAAGHGKGMTLSAKKKTELWCEDLKRVMNTAFPRIEEEERQFRSSTA